jgi:hypothetical protein
VPFDPRTSPDSGSDHRAVVPRVFVPPADLAEEDARELRKV